MYGADVQRACPQVTYEEQANTRSDGDRLMGRADLSAVRGKQRTGRPVRIDGREIGFVPGEGGASSVAETVNAR
jgi:hypothetical protein